MEININQKKQQAIKALKNGKLIEAKNLFQDILITNPTDFEVHNALGSALFSLRNFTEAVPSYKKAIELKPNFTRAHQNLGLSLQQLGELKEAEVSYKKALELKPDLPDIHNNLGAILKLKGRLYEALASYKKAIKFKPDFFHAHFNLANTLQAIGRSDEAIVSFKKAIELKPDFFEAFINLGNLFLEQKELDKAAINYNKVLELSPNNPAALVNIAQVFFDKGQYEDALKFFDSCKTVRGIYGALYSLYALNRIEDIYKRIDERSELDDKNLQVAAFSSFITYKEKKATSHKFCNNPLDFIAISNLKSHFNKPNLFINELIEELKDIDLYWQPPTRSTIRGSQSIGNLFSYPLKKINELKLIIENEIDSYYLKFKDETCSFIKKWPSKTSLKSWHVILKQQGHQVPHLHKDAWLSGVIYLKVVPALDKNEGAIELTLNGQYYSDVSSPKKIHNPKVGDIILFPSSIYHRTIPFTTNADRFIVSFDLRPNSFAD